MSGAEPEAPCFVDTNILVYAAASDDPRSVIAQELVQQLMESDRLRTSVQVLQELFVTLTRKVRVPLSPGDALRYLDGIAEWPVFAADYSAVREAVELSSRAPVSLWDALIVVAAAHSGATLLYTEDLQHGQTILGVRIVNPFNNPPRRPFPSAKPH